MKKFSRPLHTLFKRYRDTRGPRPTADSPPCRKKLDVGTATAHLPAILSIYVTLRYVTLASYASLVPSSIGCSGVPLWAALLLPSVPQVQHCVLGVADKLKIIMQSGRGGRGGDNCYF